jgi:hypothetical protein
MDYLISPRVFLFSFDDTIGQHATLSHYLEQSFLYSLLWRVHSNMYIHIRNVVHLIVNSFLFFFKFFPPLYCWKPLVGRFWFTFKILIYHAAEINCIKRPARGQLITPLDAALLGAILTLRRIGGRQTQRQPDPATSPQPVKFIFFQIC